MNEKADIVIPDISKTEHLTNILNLINKSSDRIRHTYYRYTYTVGQSFNMVLKCALATLMKKKTQKKTVSVITSDKTNLKTNKQTAVVSS